MFASNNDITLPYKCFKVSVPADMVDKFRDPDVWPKHVAIDKYDSRFYSKIATSAKELGTQGRNQNIIYLNAGSLLSNFEKISELVVTLELLVVCLSETHVTDLIFDGEIAITGYEIIRISSSTINLGCMYHSPNAGHRLFCDFFEHLLKVWTLVRYM
nr:unnamed protein product [Callosobruchus analis]